MIGQLQRGRPPGLDLRGQLPVAADELAPSTSSIQCGRCQRSIAWSRAAFVVVATCYGKKADFGSRPSRTRGGTMTA